jgi:hypothetical protein
MKLNLLPLFLVALLGCNADESTTRGTSINTDTPVTADAPSTAHPTTGSVPHSTPDSTNGSAPDSTTGSTPDPTTDSTPGSAPGLATTYGSRKFRPGHYTALLRSQDSHSVMADSMKSGVVGFMKRYSWRSLEPSLGSFDFSEIDADLAWAAAYGMKLVVMIEDKTFVRENPVPDYMEQYALRNRDGGFTIARWQPYVVERMNALTKALGSRFDSNRALEGLIITEETAPGLDDVVLDANGYTPEKYRDAYISMLNSAADSLPTSRIFWYMNFFPRNQAYIGAIANAVAPKGIVMGGPDVLPDDAALKNLTYPFYDQMFGKMPLFGQVEGQCYYARHANKGYSTKYWKPDELFQFAKNELHVNYMFWVRIPTPRFTDSYTWIDALPVIGYNSPFSP